MKIFSKRETISQNIALMAIMAAINIIFSVISALSPFVSVFLVIFLPLTSVIVELFCKDKYYPIYAIATFGLSLVTTLWNMETTIFYVIPSLLTGYIFGLMAKKKIPPIYSILLSSLVQMGLSLAFIPLVNALFQVDIINTFKSFFKLTSSPYIDKIIPAFVLVISLVQITLSYLVIHNEIQKFGIMPIADESHQWIYQLILFAICLLLIGMSFVSSEIAFVLLMIAIYLAIHIIIDYFYLHYFHILIIFAAGFILNIIIFSCYFTSLPKPSGMLLIGVTPLWIAFISTLVSFLKRKPKDIYYK